MLLVAFILFYVRRANGLSLVYSASVAVSAVAN